MGVIGLTGDCPWRIDKQVLKGHFRPLQTPGLRHAGASVRTRPFLEVPLEGLFRNTVLPTEIAYHVPAAAYRMAWTIWSLEDVDRSIDLLLPLGTA